MLFYEDECPSCGEKRGYRFSGSFIGCNDEWHDTRNNTRHNMFDNTEDDSDDDDSDYFSTLNSHINFRPINCNKLFDFSLDKKQKKVSNRDSCMYWESCKYYEDGEYCYHCKDGEYYEKFGDNEDYVEDADEDNDN